MFKGNFILKIKCKCGIQITKFEYVWYEHASYNHYCCSNECLIKQVDDFVDKNKNKISNCFICEKNLREFFKDCGKYSVLGIDEKDNDNIFLLSYCCSEECYNVYNKEFLLFEQDTKFNVIYCKFKRNTITKNIIVYI